MSDPQADQSEADGSHGDDAHPASSTPEEQQKALKALMAQPSPIGHINAARTIVLPKRDASDVRPRKDDPDE